jgi:hypothetical protein
MRTCFACWITKATDTHSQYVILIAFPRQQRLRERVSMFRYMYVAILVRNILIWNTRQWRLVRCLHWLYSMSREQKVTALAIEQRSEFYLYTCITIDNNNNNEQVS